MFTKYVATCLVPTALGVPPGMAQTSATPGTNPTAADPQAPATGSATAQNVRAAEFVTQAANSDMFEIQSSQLALNKAQDNTIRTFSHHMVEDNKPFSQNN